jgi:GcrA cell cycle regulator
VTGPFWTDERVETMRDLLAKGWPCGKVAAHLGCSRNAVIGKAHRIEASEGIKLTRRTGTKTGPHKRVLAPGAAYRKPRAEPRRTPRSSDDNRGALLIPAKPAKPAYVPGTPVGILDVTGCKWAVSESPDVIGRHLFCNAPKAEGHDRYCPHHAEMNVSKTSEATIKRTITAFGLRFPKGRAA